MLTQGFACIESARAHTLTRPTRYSKWALLRSRLQTAALKRKKKSSRDHPCWFPFEEHGRIVGITEETLICPPLSLTHTLTHSNTQTSFLSPPSVSHRCCVSAGSILGVSSTDSTTSQETLRNGWETAKAKKTCPIWSANINLDWVLGECVSKKGWKFK